MRLSVSESLPTVQPMSSCHEFTVVARVDQLDNRYALFIDAIYNLVFQNLNACVLQSSERLMPVTIAIMSVHYHHILYVLSATELKLEAAVTGAGF